MKTSIKTTIKTTVASIFLISSFSVFSATTNDTNKDDASNLGTSDTPQIKEQQKGTDKGNAMKKGSANSSTGDTQMMESNKKMDTNHDGMISKVEYMKHHEMHYGSMKQSGTGTSSGVNLNDMNSFQSENATDGGLEGKTRRKMDGAIK